MLGVGYRQQSEASIHLSRGECATRGLFKECAGLGKDWDRKATGNKKREWEGRLKHA